MARGEHLFYYRASAAYSHHGICCGDGTVIHYESSAWMKLTGGRSGQRPQVVRVPFDEFSLGHSVRVRQYDGDDTVDRVMQRAFSRLGEADYDLFDNNCEHFAVWCKTGESHSTQVQAHRTAARAMRSVGPVGIALFRTARRLPGPYRGLATAGAVAVAGSIYAGTFLLRRQRDMAAEIS